MSLKKNNIIILLFVFSSFLLQAQTLDSLKPKAEERQLTIGLFNNSGFFVFKKYRSPSVACRLGFSGTYLFKKQEGSSPIDVIGPLGIVTTYYNTTETKTSNHSLNVFFGYQMSLVNYKRFEPYIGLDLSIGNSFSSYSQETDYSNSASATNNTILRVKQERKGGFSPQLALLPLTGFNYYIADRFALGAEYRFTIFSVAKQGEEDTKRTIHYTFGASTESEPAKGNKGYTVEGSLTGTAYITATWFVH